ncbi:MAG: hypothetical protein JSV63_03965 [Candidatus Aenigmatarchaeota archaeon]|nr:MAG: hypothetical protein JSV63_03965 [Candidatus Aenigmarchaeota archaeon]
MKRKVPIVKRFMPRPEAEKSYGMRIYQGGAIPDRMVRIVNTPGWDVEACAGTHLSNTGDAVKIAITSSERLQDGIVRISMVSGAAADKYLGSVTKEAAKLKNVMEGTGFIKFSGKISVKDEFKMLSDLRKASHDFSVGIDMLAGTAEKFAKDLKNAKMTVKPMTFNDISSGMSYLFETWKDAKKSIDDAKTKAADEMSELLLQNARGGLLVEMVKGDRNDMIKIASVLISKDPKLTVVLANSAGDVIVMSKVRDAGQVMEKVAAKCGGKGGARGNLAQGKIRDVSKLKKLNI